MQFQIDDKNSFLKQVYVKQDNYYVDMINPACKRCIIFFSGNGLYYPDDVETFERIILQDNRFEWQNIAQNDEIRGYYGKIIFVRDIYKTWYIKGINAHMDTVDKVCSLLGELTEGYTITTCGNSAGGYMAVIVGMRLNADRIFSFGGQWDIRDDIETTRKALRNYLDSQYVNVVSLGNSKRIMWFYSYYAEYDSSQKEIYDKCAGNVSVFAMNTQVHGDLVFPECYGLILTKDYKDLCRLQNKYQHKIINKRMFCREFLPLKICWTIWMRDVVEHHKSLQIIAHFLKGR